MTSRDSAHGYLADSLRLVRLLFPLIFQSCLSYSCQQWWLASSGFLFLLVTQWISSTPLVVASFSAVTLSMTHIWLTADFLLMNSSWELSVCILSMLLASCTAPGEHQLTFFVFCTSASSIFVSLAHRLVWSLSFSHVFFVQSSVSSASSTICRSVKQSASVNSHGCHLVQWSLFTLYSKLCVVRRSCCWSVHREWNPLFAMAISFTRENLIAA